jgi:hypothetical protein
MPHGLPTVDRTRSASTSSLTFSLPKSERSSQSPVQPVREITGGCADRIGVLVRERVIWSRTSAAPLPGIGIEEVHHGCAYTGADDLCQSVLHLPPPCLADRLRPAGISGTGLHR